MNSNVTRKFSADFGSDVRFVFPVTGRQLGMYQNNLTGTIPRGFSAMTNLAELDIFGSVVWAIHKLLVRRLSRADTLKE